MSQTNQNGPLYPVFMCDYTGSIIPHTFLETPNITRGYYPLPKYHYASAFVTVPGSWKDDTGHPHDPIPARAYWVDARTLERVEQEMNWNPKSYELNNGFWSHSYNCTGWANQVLTNAGLDSKWGGMGANPWAK